MPYKSPKRKQTKATIIEIVDYFLDNDFLKLNPIQSEILQAIEKIQSLPLLKQYEVLDFIKQL